MHCGVLLIEPGITYLNFLVGRVFVVVVAVIRSAWSACLRTCLNRMSQDLFQARYLEHNEGEAEEHIERLRPVKQGPYLEVS